MLNCPLFIPIVFGFLAMALYVVSQVVWLSIVLPIWLPCLLMAYMRRCDSEADEEEFQRVLESIAIMHVFITSL